MSETHGSGSAHLSRRTFIRAAGAAGAGFILYATLPGGRAVAIGRVVRASLDGYSLWRVDAGELHQISFAQLASQERCE